MAKQNPYAANASFTNGLRYEIGDGVKVNLQKALDYYQKGAKEGHYLSQLKIHQTKIRIFPTLLLTALSLFSILYFLIVGVLWIGFLLSFVWSIAILWFDRDYYWYQPGLGAIWYRLNLYLAFLVYLPIGTLIPYFAGSTYFPILLLLVIGFFIFGAGILLWISNQDMRHGLMTIYGFTLLVLSISAYFIPSNGVAYSTIQVEGGLRITGYRVSQPDVVIPERINNQPVIEIGDQAFANTNIDI